MTRRQVSAAWCGFRREQVARLGPLRKTRRPILVVKRAPHEPYRKVLVRHVQTRWWWRADSRSTGVMLVYLLTEPKPLIHRESEALNRVHYDFDRSRLIIVNSKSWRRVIAVVGQANKCTLHIYLFIQAHHD